MLGLQQFSEFTKRRLINWFNLHPDQNGQIQIPFHGYNGNTVKRPSILDNLGIWADPVVSKAMRDFQLNQAGLVRSTPNFQRYRQLYALIPEAASVINTIKERIPDFVVYNSEGYVDTDLKSLINSKYNLSTLIKDLALQILVYNNCCLTIDKTEVDQTTMLNGFVIPSMNELNLFQNVGNKIVSLQWFNSNFGVNQIYEKDFYFHKGSSIDNQFFGDSKLEPLYYSISNLFRDGENFKLFLDQGSFPGILFTLPRKMAAEARIIIIKALEEWSKDRSRFKSATLDDVEGLQIHQIEPKLNLVSVVDREYIWKTIATSYSVPSELFLRTSGLGQGEQTTMLENLKHNAILPVTQVIERMLTEFILPQLYTNSNLELPANLELKLAEVSVETEGQRAERLRLEVMQLGRPLIDYYEKTEGINVKDAYAHYNIYYQPSGVMIQKIGETVTTANTVDGQIVEGQSIANQDKAPGGLNYEVPQLVDIQTAELEPVTVSKTYVELQLPAIVSGGSSEGPEAAGSSSVVEADPNPVDNHDHHFQKALAIKQKARIKQFSFSTKANEEETSSIPAVYATKEYDQLQSKLRQLLNLTYQFNLTRLDAQYSTPPTDEVGKANVQSSFTLDNAKLDLTAVANSLYLIGLMGLSDTQKYIDQVGQPLTLTELETIQSQLRNYIITRLQSLSAKAYILDPSLETLLDTELAQFEFRDISLAKVSTQDVLSLFSSEEQPTDLKTKTEGRANRIAQQESLAVFGLATALAYKIRPPKLKTKLPTTAKDPREIHAALNGETVPYNQPFSDGSFVFPNPTFYNCQCSIKVTY